MPLQQFHPAVSHWFNQVFDSPTEAQLQAWPSIKANKPTLIAAPTGSGKTLAAFLASIDSLICEGEQHGLPETTQILYISPLKALSNDIEKNLQLPLNGIRDALLESGHADIPVTAAVRTGDTTQSERSKMRRNPPHILVTTPESLYLLLSSVSGREMLHGVRSVIVDEIHALAGNKRGAHLSLSLQRLSALCVKHAGSEPIRIGLSATQKPIKAMAQFLVGEHQECNIVDTGHSRDRDLAIELPETPLEAILSNDAWDEVYDKLSSFTEDHRTTLVFVNTRRLAERAAHHLAERIGEEFVTSHHGSLSKEHRFQAEQKLKNGELKILVATASLELGIDIGDIDLVCQLGSPHSIAAFLQRVGRSGHSINARPKGRLFPASRDDLVECVALLDAIRNEELDRISIPSQPLDVMAQQIVAEVANREWSEQALYQQFKLALPYKNLTHETFTAVTRMLADGFSTRRGRRGAYLHRDSVNGILRPRRSARIVALTNAGSIPDQFDTDVILQPEGYSIGNLNEDFTFESIPGDIFQLGNTSYRMLKFEQGKVFVEDAHGVPPNIPFWLGEAPGRTDELSSAVAQLRERVGLLLAQGSESTQGILKQELGLSDSAAQQITEYFAAAKAAFNNKLPTQSTIIFERFFDEANDMHFVIHAPFGSRINRAWGLALRKRFCRKFNFELQAAATDDNIILSLGPTHSFPLEEVKDYLKSTTVRGILIQAMLDAPMFATQWRWNCNISLAVPRNRNGKRVPAQFQRSNAEDLIAVIFPDQLACLENIAGNREIPDHPLVEQTLDDCLHTRMDIDGLEKILQKIENNEIEIITADLTSPSPLAQEIINARPYAFLDDAPAEERRTLAIQQRRHLDVQSATELGKLDADAIARVRQEAWPAPRDAEECHDALVVLGFMSDSEAVANNHYIDDLMQQNRVTRLSTEINGVIKKIIVAAERLAQFLILFPNAEFTPQIQAVVENTNPQLDPEQILIEIIRSRLDCLGPVTIQQLATPLGLSVFQVEQSLLALEQQGYVVRGNFTNNQEAQEWCERGLLARIHRYTVKRLRNEVAAVSPAHFMSFLFHWQRLDDPLEGSQALNLVLDQLEGLILPAAAWEADIIPARLQDYLPHWLDQACTSGLLSWLRLNPLKTKENKLSLASPIRTTPISLIARPHVMHWRSFTTQNSNNIKHSSHAQQVYDYITQHGAMFFSDLVSATGLLRTQLENALGELVNTGELTADSFAGLRALMTPSQRKPSFGGRRLRRLINDNSIEDAGRWSLTSPVLKNNNNNESVENTSVQHIAETLLLRYGVVFKKLLDRENLPSWRDLLYCYHRMEARGEIRGGRFVTGFSGQQFALPEAVSMLRQFKQNESQHLIAISACDPLNLTGIFTPGKRVPAVSTNRIVYYKGVAIATNLKGVVSIASSTPAEIKQQVESMLIRKRLRHATV